MRRDDVPVHDVTIGREPPDAPGVELLLSLSTQHARSLYPPEHTFLLDVSELARPEVSCYVARDAAGRALGMAALVRLSAERGELKRMFVHPDARGTGTASRLMRRIEADGRTAGLRWIVLETGTRHDVAQAVYRRHGYAVIEQFGPYVGGAVQRLHGQVARGLTRVVW